MRLILIFTLIVLSTIVAMAQSSQPDEQRTTGGSSSTDGGTGTLSGDTPAGASEYPTAPSGFEHAMREVPAFVFRSLDDSTAYISSASLAGTVYLVDFWATWCPPCVEALPSLHELHEEFHPRGFEIVSLSFDSSDERVAQFRAKRFRMPWKHGRLEGGFGDIIAITFALENIPHYVLVGRDGQILAEGDDLHGERLRNLLASALEE